MMISFTNASCRQELQILLLLALSSISIIQGGPVNSRVLTNNSWKSPHSHSSSSCLLAIATETTAADPFTSAPPTRTSSTVSTSAIAPPGKNPIAALGTYIANEAKSFTNKSKELYSNHKRCNAIRSQQKMGQRIPYRDFQFLETGREDRGKVTTLAFWTFFQPKNLYWVIMLNPGMLPGPFKASMEGSMQKRVVQQMRGNAVLRTMMEVEVGGNMAIKAGGFKLNPFGGGAAIKLKEKLGVLQSRGLRLLQQPDVTPEQLLELLKPHLTSNVPFTKAQLGLCDLPKPFVKGLNAIIAAPAAPGISITPTYFTRMSVNKYLVSVTAADVFLRANSDEVLSGEDLFSACEKRGITSKPSAEKLKHWLELTKEVPGSNPVATPKAAANGDGVEETGVPPVYVNHNLQRAVLLGYNTVMSTRHREEGNLAQALFEAPRKNGRNDEP